MKRSRRLALAAAVSAAVVSLTVVVSSGAGDSRPLLKTRDHLPGAKMTVQRRRGSNVAYLAASGTLAPQANIGHRGRCPRRTPHPVSGIITSSSTRTVLTDSAPIGDNPRTNRDWGVALTNLSADQHANYTVGVVCIRLR